VRCPAGVPGPRAVAPAEVDFRPGHLILFILAIPKNIRIFCEKKATLVFV
jgi:hypothetical protein